MGGNPIQFDYTFIFIFLPILFSLIFLGPAVYLLVIAIRFFKRKTVIDQEILQKLNDLIKLQTKPADKKYDRD
ncbi:hypothetical protein DSBG_4213 [Desulfosporosinus sp. BG]|nr:hypothetical protein DSBG_4213 [Desulfosporosinus sp. BG]